MSVLQRQFNLKQIMKETPVSFALVVINTLVFVIGRILYEFTDIDFYTLGALNPEVITYFNEWYRLFTAAFLHFEFFHFLSNVVIGIYILCSALERIIGSTKFSLIYFGSMLLSSLLVFALSDGWTLGASGAIFGGLGALLYITFYRPDLLPIQDIQRIRGLVIINVVFTLIFRDTISLPGHAGGLLAGLLLGYLFVPRDKEDQDIYYS